jgi:RNA polymerase sigma factor (sigma-70 family)
MPVGWSRSSLLGSVQRLFEDGTVVGVGEGQLLQRFVVHRDEAAFEAIVRSHGPMVLGVCRRVLRDPHDADDAFQATFLILARKAGTIRDRQVLGSWLYGVAYRVASRARVIANRSRRQARTGLEEIPVANSIDTLERRELRLALDEEINRLAERYRVPIVLHYFEGRTHAEIAEQLLCPVGTVHSRLTRARERLRERLTRRGLDLGVSSASPLWESEPSAISLALVDSMNKVVVRIAAGRAVDGLVSDSVVTLVNLTLRSLSMIKLTIAASLVLALGIVATGVGVLARQGANPPPAKARVTEEQRAPSNLPTTNSVSSYEFKMAGAGDANSAPEGLVAVLGDSRLKHWSDVMDVAFTPDGTRIASASGDGTVRLWDVVTGEERLRLHSRRMWEGGLDFLRCVAISPDGKTVAAGGLNNAVLIWELTTGREVRAIRLDAEVWSLAFHPDGRRLATGQIEDARLWDVATGERLYIVAAPAEGSKRTQVHEHVSVAFAPGGLTLATANLDGTVRYWDTATGKPENVLQAHASVVSAIAFSPDGRYLATGGADKAVKVWGVTNGALLHTFDKAHEYAVQAVAFRRDGTLASGGADGVIRYWNPETGAPLKSIKVTDVGGVLSMAFSPGGEALVSAGRIVQVHDTESGRPRFDFPGHAGQVDALAFSPDGRSLATAGGDSRVKLWDLTSRQERLNLAVSKSTIAAVAFNPGGETLASLEVFGKTVKLWETATGRLSRELPVSGNRGLSLAYSPDGRWLAAAHFVRGPYGSETGINIWEAKTGKLHGQLTAGSPTILFSRDGERMFIFESRRRGRDDGLSLTIRKLAGLQVEAQLDNFEGMGGLAGAVVGADGRTLAVAGWLFGSSDDRRMVVILWDVLRQRRRLVLDVPDQSIDGVALAPDGRSFVTFSSREGNLRVWDPRNGVLRRTLTFPDPGYHRIQAVAFAPDGQHIATAMGNGTAYILRLKTPRSDVEEVAIIAPGPPNPTPEPTDLWEDTVNKPAPELREIKGWLFGEPIQMASLRGKYVLLHFWNVFSEQRMPGLMKLQRQFGGHGLVVIVVYPDHVGRTFESTGKSFDELSRKWWGSRTLPFRVALDGGPEVPIPGTSLKAPGATHAAYRIPDHRKGRRLTNGTNLLIGPDGRVLKLLPVLDTGGHADRDFEKLLGAAPARAPWMEAFERRYLLTDGQVLKRVAPPFPPERSEFIFESQDWFRGGQYVHCFMYDGKLIDERETGNNGRMALRELLRLLIRLKSYEFQGPDDLLRETIAGDWIYRGGTAQSDLLAALGTILREELGLRVKIERREIEREVIVVRGRYQARPLLAGDEGKVLHIFVEPAPPQSSFGGDSSGNLRKLLDRLGDQFGRRFNDESQTPGELKIEWRDHLALLSPEQRQDLNAGGALLDRLLENLSKQTSLQFRRELHKESVWSLARDQ